MVSLGGFIFPEKRTVVQIRTREVLSRVRKEIEVHSVFTHYADLDALKGDLEAMEGELEKFDRGEVQLSIHEGRFFTGRRRDLQRQVEPQCLVAAISLSVLTDDRFERSVVERQENLTLTQSGESIAISQAGNAPAFARFNLAAGNTLIEPQIDDGVRSIRFEDTLNAGETLELDSDQRTAVKNGTENVLHLMNGKFPLLSPGSATITSEAVTATICWSAATDPIACMATEDAT